MFKKNEMSQFPLPEQISEILFNHIFVRDTIGCSSTGVYRCTCGDDVKYLKIAPSSDEIRRERDLLLWMNGKVPVPEVVHYCERGKNAYLILDNAKGHMAIECSGTQSRVDEVRKPAKNTVKLLADGLKMLQAVDISDCPYNNTLDHKLEQGLYNINNNLVNMDDFEKWNDFSSPIKLHNWLAKNRPYEELSFTHGDYCLPNIFVDDKEVTGFIDVGRGGIADKWQDIALCARSLGYNLQPKCAAPNVDVLFDCLGVKPDYEKIHYYILLDELF